MRLTLDYGQRRITLEAAAERIVDVRQGPRSLGPEEVAVAVRDALEAPLDFPPIRQAVVPGDRVVIALDSAHAALGAVLRPILELLMDAGVSPADVTLLTGMLDARAAGRFLSDLRDSLPSEIQVEVHDPAEPTRLSYLASTSSGRRVYLNRTVVDADLVLPLGRLGYDPVFGYRRTISGVYPGLSNEDSRRSFRAQVDGRALGDEDREGGREVDEVGWLLGIQSVVQIVAGHDQGISRVLAGSAAAVQSAGDRCLDAGWLMALDRRADLVVAAITGDPAYQTMEDIAAGLAAAQRAVRRGGQIVLLSDVAPELGPGLQGMGRAEDPGAALVRLQRDLPPDLICAYQAAAAAAWARVYLLSGLPEDAVESMFMIPLSRESEIQRLVQAADSCLFLSDVQGILPVIRCEERGS